MKSLLDDNVVVACVMQYDDAIATKGGQTLLSMFLSSNSDERTTEVVAAWFRQWLYLSTENMDLIVCFLSTYGV